MDKIRNVNGFNFVFEDKTNSYNHRYFQREIGVIDENRMKASSLLETTLRNEGHKANCDFNTIGCIMIVIEK